jgi:hypothetical protein
VSPRQAKVPYGRVESIGLCIFDAGTGAVAYDGSTKIQRTTQATPLIMGAARSSASSETSNVRSARPPLPAALGGNSVWLKGNAHEKFAPSHSQGAASAGFQPSRPSIVRFRVMGG